MEITTIGLDLAKNVFQVHGVDATGEVVVRKALRRSQMLPFFAKLPPCLVGIEACGTSHHWARELIKLGHEVRLMPPAYVKPYVKRGKTDAADAEAICEAVTRPTMRFVPVKSRGAAGGAVDAPHARSAGQAAHAAGQHDPRAAGRVRHRHPARDRASAAMARQIVDGEAPDVPAEAANDRRTLSQQLLDIHAQVREIDRDLLAWQREQRRCHAASRRSRASARSARPRWPHRSPIPHQFRSGRQFAAWLGLTPLQKSSGGKERLGRITQDGRQISAQAAHRRHDLAGAARARDKPETVDPRLRRICWRESPRGSPPSRWPTRRRASSGRSWRAAKSIEPATCRRWRHRRSTGLADERSASRGCESDAM